MPYFPNQDENQEPGPQHERKFYQPVEDDDPYNELDNDEMPLDYDGPLTQEEEMAERRRGTFRVLSGVGDFLGVIAGTAVILVLLAILISLGNWVIADMIQSFDLLQMKL